MTLLFLCFPLHYTMTSSGTKTLFGDLLSLVHAIQLHFCYLAFSEYCFRFESQKNGDGNGDGKEWETNSVIVSLAGSL